MKLKLLEEKARNNNSLNRVANFNYLEILDVVRCVKLDKVPDGRFSDNQCNLWSAIRSIMEHGENSDFVDMDCRSV